MIDLIQNVFNNWRSKPDIPFYFNTPTRGVRQNLGLSRNNGFNQQRETVLCLSHSFMKQNGSYLRSQF